MALWSSVGRFFLLFIEVFFVFMTALFVIGATMETIYAGIGLVMTMAGFVYAYTQRENLDLLDRYFYSIIGVLLAYLIAFLAVK